MIVDPMLSLDSSTTAVGMVDELAMMIAAVVVSVALMMVFAGPIGRFVSNHPTIKMPALSFRVVVGVMLDNTRRPVHLHSKRLPVGDGTRSSSFEGGRTRCSTIQKRIIACSRLNALLRLSSARVPLAHPTL